ncbi:LysE family translocator [Psychrobacter immobilis]|uniref:LysE family translocator n=1 Tax=Psychrobacter immobilis TaxID=498 RepID=UPI00191B05A2|nr:LysE family translocator [Psychrobacter immobilis]
MIDYSLLVAYFLAILLFLGTPGPVTVLVVSASVKSGFKAGLATVAGTNIASLVLIAISFIILQGVFSVSETAMLWLSFLGAFYLIYFSITIIKDKIDIQQTVQENSSLVTKNHFKDGFLIGISNPKDIIFFIAFFPLFLEVSSDIYSSMLILTLVWILLDYSLLSIYCFIFSKVSSNRVANIIGRVSGTILLLIGIYVLWETSRRLFL